MLFGVLLTKDGPEGCGSGTRFEVGVEERLLGGLGRWGLALSLGRLLRKDFVERRVGPALAQTGAGSGELGQGLNGSEKIAGHAKEDYGGALRRLV